MHYKLSGVDYFILYCKCPDMVFKWNEINKKFLEMCTYKNKYIKYSMYINILYTYIN